MTKDEGPMSDAVRGLKCRLCGKTYPKEPLNFCTDDFGPLEVDYDYEAIAESVSRPIIERRAKNKWRVPRVLSLGRGAPRRGPGGGAPPFLRHPPPPQPRA